MKHNTRSCITRVFTRYPPLSRVCPSCKKQMIRIVKLSEEGEETLNFTYVCTNPRCLHKIDVKKIGKGWKIIRESRSKSMRR